MPFMARGFLLLDILAFVFLLLVIVFFPLRQRFLRTPVTRPVTVEPIRLVVLIGIQRLSCHTWRIWRAGGTASQRSRSAGREAEGESFEFEDGNDCLLLPDEGCRSNSKRR